MKKLFTLGGLFIFAGLFVFSFINANAQTQRNPVFEFCTGVWCQWCPCGDNMMDNILAAHPNVIPLAYHGLTYAPYYDPYGNFNGNNILALMGMNSFPTGTADRMSPLGDYTTWTSKVNSSLSIPATVSIEINKTYNETTRHLNATVFMTPLEDLTGQYSYNIILTEDSLIYNQINNGACIGGGANWVHKWVVRDMINGATGESLNSGSTWNTGDMITKTVSYDVSTDWNADKCNLTVFVYKQYSPLYLANIQQGEQWTLVGDITPVELTSFTSSVSYNGITLNWQTASELNNNGFEIEKSTDGKNFFRIGFVKGAGTSTENHEYSYFDKLNLNGQNMLYYRLKQVDFSGTYQYSNTLSILYDMPRNFSLSQNYPNPFNPTTTIEYSVAKESQVSINVYDIMGREVTSLVNEKKSPGTYDVTLNATNLASGVYFYKMTAGDFVSVKKMSVLK
jgi:Outer membrane protein Omp28/Secretion system C-terminal sorting domain